ncbi:MAG: hypothetical protein VCA36_06250, partial [Opitutales bacterium]
NWSQFRWVDLGGLVDTFPAMMLGGLVLGSFAGLIGMAIYKYLAMRTKAYYPSDKQSETNEGEGTEEA